MLKPVVKDGMVTILRDAGSTMIQEQITEDEAKRIIREAYAINPCAGLGGYTHCINHHVWMNMVQPVTRSKVKK